MAKKLFPLISLVLVLTMVLAACAQPTAAPTEAPTSAAPTEAPTAAPAAITLTLWHGMTGAEAEALATIIQNFQTANPNITVNTLAVPFDQLQNKFTTEASTGAGADIFFGPKDWIGTLANSNLIAPLDDYSTQIGLDQLIPTTVDANKFNGKVYAFPESSDMMALWYNKTMIQTPPTTSDELIAAAANYGLAFNYGFYQAAGIIFAEGAQLFDANQKCILDQGTGTVDALNFMLTLYQSPGVKSDTNGSNLDALFKGGEVGLIFNGEWATGDYEAALGAENVGIVAPITMAPSGKTFAPFLGMKNIFLSANSKGDSLNAALAFLKYMSTTEAQSVFAGVGHIPTNPNVQVTDPVTEGFINQSKSTTYFPNEPEMGAVWTPAGDMITKVLTAGADPAAAVAEAVKTINTANNK
jgi:arabinogalactan oligomer/maltooligosaccharide transport system substrate-binding protein